MLRKTMVASAIALALGSSALSTSAFARGGFGGGHTTIRRDADHNGYFSRLPHRGLLQCYGCGYDPWGHWGAYYGPMITVP
jgi:hypothetical protein